MKSSLNSSRPQKAASRELQDIKVSVIMALYNAEDYVLDSVDSALDQTHKNLELIICNDASNDGSMAIVSRISDPRLIVLENEINSGVSATRNRCLQEATGDYVAILDADDIWERNKLDSQLRFLEGNDEIGIVGSQVTEIDSNGEITGIRDFPFEHKQIMDFRLWACPFLHSSILVRSELMLNYDTGVRQAEDWELENRILSKSRGANLPERLVRYRVHVENLTNSKSEEQRIEALAVVRNFPEIRRLSPADLNLFSQIFAYQIHALQNGSRAILLMLKIFIQNGFQQESAKRLWWVTSRTVRNILSIPRK